MEPTPAAGPLCHHQVRTAVVVSHPDAVFLCFILLVPLILPLPLISNLVVVQQLDRLRLRFDHMSDQMEQITARLPGLGNPTTPAPAEDNGDSLADSVLRGKLELQNLRLASEYAALLPIEQRKPFLQEFSAFFSNVHTAGQASSSFQSHGLYTLLKNLLLTRMLSRPFAWH